MGERRAEAGERGVGVSGFPTELRTDVHVRGGGRFSLEARVGCVRASVLAGRGVLGGRVGVCHSACQTRGSECRPGPLGRVRPRRWPGVGAVVAPKRWPGPEGSCGQGKAQRRPRLRVASFSPPPTSLARSPCLRGPRLLSS